VEWGWAGDRNPDSTIWLQVFVQNKDDEDEKRKRPM
jgi:hypothetical protein